MLMVKTLTCIVSRIRFVCLMIGSVGYVREVSCRVGPRDILFSVFKLLDPWLVSALAGHG